MHFLSIDLGATSGRTVLATFDGQRIDMREFTRFDNPQLPLTGHIVWNLPHLYNEILRALRKVKAEGLTIQSIGIDTWGCDFAFFDSQGQLLALPLCYRDPHTDGAIDRYLSTSLPPAPASPSSPAPTPVGGGSAAASPSPGSASPSPASPSPASALYDRTGIQFMPFNSLFQLDTLRRAGSIPLQHADKILFIPDALIYMLTGEAVCEYTVASTSQMLNPRTGDLDPVLLQSLNLSRDRFGRLVQPGEQVGTLTPHVQAATGLGPIPVIAVASHDTASAVAAVPAQDAHFAYLSCGTWSLLGVEAPQPIINDASFAHNFTNEGGLDHTIRFLKNITGLWIFEQCRKEWGAAPSSPATHVGGGSAAAITPAIPADVNALNALCLTSTCDSIINPDDPRFAHPASMTAAIREYLTETHQPIPQSPADYVRVIFRSLAARYQEIVTLLRQLTPVDIQRLHVIGGGSRNQYLMQFTADALGLPVIAGPQEGTALGNALVQLRAASPRPISLTDLRVIAARSVTLTTYLPTNNNKANLK